MKLDIRNSESIRDSCNLTAPYSPEKNKVFIGKKWTSNDTLISRLEEALSKTADRSKIVAVRRILKELEEK